MMNMEPPPQNATVTLPQRMAMLFRALSVDPVGVARALPGEWRQKQMKSPFAESDFESDWYERLHGLLGVPWPCPEAQRVQDLLADIAKLLQEKGFRSGRHSYGWYCDAEAELCCAIWCTVRHARPEVVIETGVAHGVSSRVALEAMSLNDRGHLWSIDLPHPLKHDIHDQTGAAVTDECRPRWTYIEGESRRRLPPLVAEVGRAQLFIHDSLHTAKNMLFEMEQAASIITPGGVILVDDIKANDAFLTFTKRHPEYETLRCATSDGIYGFGVAVLPRGA
jgi:hypothetical protein